MLRAVRPRQVSAGAISIGGDRCRVRLRRFGKHRETKIVDQSKAMGWQDLTHSDENAKYHCYRFARLVSDDTGQEGFAHKAPPRESFLCKIQRFCAGDLRPSQMLRRIMTRLVRSGQSSQLAMSAFGGKADICSDRVFPLLAQSGHPPEQNPAVQRCRGLPSNIENVQNGAIWYFFARASGYHLCQQPLQLF